MIKKIGVTLFLFFLFWNIYVEKNKRVKLEKQDVQISNFNNESVMKRDIKIYVYDNDTNENEEIKVGILKNGEIELDDYINSVIDETDYIKSDMKFLAVYEILENNKKKVIIKVSREFNNLEQSKLVGFSKSLTKTILENYDDIDSVYLQIDTN